MKTAVVLLGVILILVGLVLAAYKVEIITGYETETEFERVPLEEVESMKEQGWTVVRPLVYRGVSAADVIGPVPQHDIKVIYSNGTVLFYNGTTKSIEDPEVVKYLEWLEAETEELRRKYEAEAQKEEVIGYIMKRDWVTEYYIDVYPYQGIGVIVLLIGLVTSVVGFYIPSISEVAETEAEGETGQENRMEVIKMQERKMILAKDIISNPEIVGKIETKYQIVADASIASSRFDALNKAISIMVEKGWRCVNITMYGGTGVWMYALMEKL